MSRPNGGMRPGRGGPRGMATKENLNLKVLGRLIKNLFKDYPVILTLIFICVIVNAAVGVMPAIYIKTITEFIVKGLETGKVSGAAAAWLAIKGDVIKAVIIMASVFLVGIGCNAVQSQLGAIMTQGFLDKTRRRMFDKMQNLPVKFFDVNTHGDVMSYYTNDIDTLRQLISQGIPSIVQAIVTLTVLVCVMIYNSVSLMLVVIFGIIIISLVTKAVGGKSAKYFMRQQAAVGKR